MIVFSPDTFHEGSRSPSLWDADGSTTYNNVVSPRLITEWTDEHAQPETGTFAELNVQPGDVVKMMTNVDKEHVGLILSINEDGKAVGLDGDSFLPQYDVTYERTYRIISRASQSTTPFAHPTTPHSPIRTVARKEILPGVYGRVTVERLDNSDWCFEVKSMRTIEDLTAAIETLTAIKDALNDG